MYRFVLGFFSGIYVGTHYDCNPMIKKIKNVIYDNLPDEKNNN
jgi:hypothetical protein